MNLSDLFPSNYIPSSDKDPDAPQSRYLTPSKVPDGSSIALRLCGTPSSGHVICGYSYFTNDNQPRRFPAFPKNYRDDIGLSWEGKNKGTGEKARPVYFLSWACMVKGSEDFQILTIEQTKVREAIEKTLSMEDYMIEAGEMANFFLDISRSGKGKDTSYTVIPTLKVASKEDQRRWQEARSGIWLPALFEGGDPFAGKPSGHATSSGGPMTSRDELGADQEIASRDDW